MENIINKLLNILIVVIVVLIVICIAINLLTPLLYSDTSKVYNSSYDYLSQSHAVIERYLGYVMDKDYSNINKCIATIRRKNNTVYDNYSIYLNENYSEVNITKIEQVGYKNYLVTYTINTGRENKIVLHFDNDAKTAKVYYDKLLLQF